MRTSLSALRLLLLLTLLLGGAYPALVWAIGQAAFPNQANGSLVHDTSGRVVGSSLLAQRTDDPRYVHPRPSAADYATLPSGASNQGWTDTRLRQRLAAAAALGIHDERATESASGLDPHLTPGAVRAQLDRVCAARGWGDDHRAQVEAWIAAHTESGQIGPPVVNVLQLNLALDRLASGS